MNRKRWTIVALALAVVALIVPPLTRVVVEIRQQQAFYSLVREGTRIIDSFEEVRPEHIPPKIWHVIVGDVHNTWGNVIFAPYDIDSERLREILEQLRQLRAGSDAENVVEQLDQIFELLLRSVPKRKSYIEGMREMYWNDVSYSSKKGDAAADE